MEKPAWKRRAFRYLVSFPIIALCLVSVFVVMFLMLRLQVIVDLLLICSHNIQIKAHDGNFFAN